MATRGRPRTKDRCETCGRPSIETAEQKFRRTLLKLLPPDSHERVGRLLNLSYEVGSEPSAILLRAFDSLAADLSAQGIAVE